jgi:hypothetical protein
MLENADCTNGHPEFENQIPIEHNGLCFEIRRISVQIQILTLKPQSIKVCLQHSNIFSPVCSIVAFGPDPLGAVTVA